MTPEYSALPPSKAHIWGPFDGCTGWLDQSAYTQQRLETAAMRQAKEARALAIEMIKSYARGGLEFPVRELYDPEIYQSARVFADDVRTVMQETRVFGGDYLRIDHFAPCPSISEHTKGHIDCAIMDRSTFHLYVWLFRNGHKSMEATGNLRGACYISALMEEYGMNGKDDQVLQVTFRIVQPNAHDREGPIKQWRFGGYELRNYVNILHDSAQRQLGTGTKCKTGPYCTGCDARYNCDAVWSGGMTMYEALSAPMVDELSPRELAHRYTLVKKALDIIKSLDTAYSQQMESLLRTGKGEGTGYVANQKFGRLDWDRPIDEIIALGDLNGADLRKNGTLTPTQAIDAGIPEETIRLYASRKSSGWEIIPAASLTDRAKEIFS